MIYVGESVRKQFRVVIIDFIADDLSPEKEILGELADVEAFNAHNEEGLSGRIEDVDAIMLYHSVPLTPKTIGQLEKCKLIVRCGVGCDNVDLVAAAKHGIPVANVPDYGTEEVADSAIGLTLALTRGITFLNSRLRDNLGPLVLPASDSASASSQSGFWDCRPRANRNRRCHSRKGFGYESPVL